MFKKKALLVLAITAAAGLGIIFGVGLTLGLQEISEQGEQRAAAYILLGAYLGQAKDFIQLDPGHYTVLTVLESYDFCVVKQNLPTGDIVLLVHNIPPKIQEAIHFTKS